MTATRTLFAALALGSVLGMSCYSEPQPPSTYRYACDGDSDCNANEACISGRCERPCHPLSYFAGLLLGVDGPCPFTDGYAGCYNGACANTCDLDNDLCPSGRRCEDFGIQVSGGGGFGGSNNTRYGVCAVPCTENSCPFGQACDEDGHCAPDPSLLCLPSDVTGVELDFCFQTCTDDSACPDDYYCEVSFASCAPKCSPECPSGQTCFLGVCATACGDDGSCPDDECCRFDRVCSPADVDLPFPGGECQTDASTSGSSTSGSSTSGGSTSDGSTSDGSTSDGSTSGGPTSGGSTSGSSTSM